MYVFSARRSARYKAVRPSERRRTVHKKCKPGRAMLQLQPCPLGAEKEKERLTQVENEGSRVMSFDQ